MNKNMRISISRGKTASWLVFSAVEFDKETGIEIDGSKRVGFKEVLPGKEDAALRAAQDKEWTLSDEPDAQGYYKVSEVTKAVSGKELAQKNGKEAVMA